MERKKFALWLMVLSIFLFLGTTVTPMKVNGTNYVTVNVNNKTTWQRIGGYDNGMSKSDIELKVVGSENGKTKIEYRQSWYAYPDYWCNCSNDVRLYYAPSPNTPAKDWKPCSTVSGPGKGSGYFNSDGVTLWKKGMPHYATGNSVPEQWRIYHRDGVKYIKCTATLPPGEWYVGERTVNWCVGNGYTENDPTQVETTGYFRISIPTYKIKTQTSTGGKITATMNNIEAGATKTITYASDHGYQLQKVEVVDNGQKKDVTKTNPTSYTFKNIVYDNFISVEYKPIEAIINPAPLKMEGDWTYEGISPVNITKKTDDGKGIEGAEYSLELFNEEIGDYEKVDGTFITDADGSLTYELPLTASGHISSDEVKYFENYDQLTDDKKKVPDSENVKKTKAEAEAFVKDQFIERAKEDAKSKKFKVRITELSVPDGYVALETPIETEVGFKEIKEVDFDNKAITTVPDSINAELSSKALVEVEEPEPIEEEDVNVIDSTPEPEELEKPEPKPVNKKIETATTNNILKYMVIVLGVLTGLVLTIKKSKKA